MKFSTPLFFVAITMVLTLTTQITYGAPLHVQSNTVRTKKPTPTPKPPPRPPVPSFPFFFPRGTAFAQGLATIPRGPTVSGQVVAPGSAFVAGGAANETAGGGLAVGGGGGGGRAQAVAEPGLGKGTVVVETPDS